MIIERNNIYNVDCLVGLRDMLRGGVLADCVITDPPYLINYQTRHRQNRQDKFCKPIANDDNPQLIIDLIPLLYDVMKDNTPLYMFCGSDKVDFFKQQVETRFTIKNIIVWDKGNHTAGDLGAQYGKRYEFIIYANKGRAPFNDDVPRYDDVWAFPRVTGAEQIHQNQKPIPLLMRIVKQHTKPHDLILDPFMGSCSTAVAAHKLQRDFIGFEIDKDEYDAGVKRLNAERAQVSIFDIFNL
ncbi:MAG: site-specific DNA-methyltransferase [Lachnospiraceae bacterium]|nr:site-specific DNA-methyltransferase [Lachnospiraceae bacterium]